MRNFMLIAVAVVILATVHAFGNGGKLTVIKVSIASVAGKAFEVQIAPTGDRSPRRAEMERRVRDCATRDGNHAESFHSEFKVEVTEGSPNQVAIKSEVPKGLSAVARCIQDDLKANIFVN
jgi:hypothetical protein